MAETIATTKLEAVNSMLTAIGEQHVATIAGTLAPDTALAVHILDETHKEVLAEGWRFNTERDVTLTPVANAITLASDVIWVDIDPDDNAGTDVTARGSTLFNLTTNTATFTSDITVSKLVRLIAFTSLPQHARVYIIARAVRKFYDVVTEGSSPNQSLMRNEMDSRRVMKAMESDEEDLNLFDGFAAGRIINRYSPLRRF